MNFFLNRIQLRFSNIEWVEYIIMPNHIPGIISIVGAPLVGARTTEIDSPKRADTRPAPTMGLGDIVGTFKSIKTILLPIYYLFNMGIVGKNLGEIVDLFFMPSLFLIFSL